MFLSAAAVLIFCIVAVIFTALERKAAREQYTDMQALYEATPTPAVSNAPGASAPAATPAETLDPAKWYALFAKTADKRIDFTALSARNADACAWISVAGTAIDLPVLRHPSDEDFYLSHDIDGRESEHGAICIDPRCKPDFSDRVTMVYGHNMLDGSMFAPLYDFYTDASFFSAEHRITVYIDNAMLTYRVIAAYEYGHEQPLYYYNMEDDEDFLRYCDTFLGNTDLKAKIQDGVAVTPDDRILTLITSTNVRADRRLFVQAVLIHE